MQISKNSLFIWWAVSFLGGLFIYNLDFNREVFLYFFCAIMALLLCICILTKRYYILLPIIVLWYGGGWALGYSHAQQLQQKQALILDYGSSQKYTVEYEILSIYSVWEYSKQYLAQVERIDGDDLDLSLRALIDIPYNFSLAAGDVIEAENKISLFRSSDSFAYKEYMASKNIYFKAYVNSFTRLRYIDQGVISWTLQWFRAHFLEIIYQIYPPTEAVFLWWILIGARESLPDELKTNFNNSGLTHFIAVSWFNMTILILFLTYVLRYLPVWIRLIAITLSIIWFTMLVGETAPVLRAAIMGLVGYYVLMSGRSWDSLAIILLSAIGMLFWSPYSLNYDVSFHLSFLAVIGIVYTQEFFTKVFGFLPDFFHIREAFVLTMAALSFTLPIMIFNFGQISLLSPLANIAVTWTIPLAMLLWFLSVLGYMITPFIGVVIGYFAWVFLKWDMLMVEFFGTQEYALLQVDFWILASYFEWLYFIVLTAVILYARAPKKDSSLG